MTEEIIEFTVTGSPRVVSRAIEQYATGHGSLHAIVVPWESDDVTLSMAVTSAKGDGWAIEHTNLGTIRLTGLENDLTRVAFAPREPDHAEKQKLAALFDGFARQIQSSIANRAMTELTSSPARGNPHTARRGGACRGHRPRHRAAGASRPACAWAPELATS